MTIAVIWSDDATTDFLDVLDYIAERNVAAADRLEALVQHAADRLPIIPTSTAFTIFVPKLECFHDSVA